MQTQTFVRLTPKTTKGKNRIREAKTDIWLIVKAEEKVNFSSVIGQWILIEPTQRGPKGKQDLWRWLNMASDADFSVSVLDSKQLPEGLN